jgi:ankyrin repeat protein
MIACYFNRISVVKAIIEWRDDCGYGVDLNAKDREGDTALDWSLILPKNGNNVADFLYSKGV